MKQMDSQGGVAQNSADERRKLLAKLLSRRAQKVRAFPVSFAQQRLWFLNRLDPDSPAYNMPGACRMTGNLDVSALQNAINEIVQRHEILRTCFASREGEPVQIILPQLSIEMPLVCLEDIPAAEQPDVVSRLVREEAHRAFDLEKGPLLRAKVLRLCPDEHVVVFAFHHIIADGWSQGLFFREMVALYSAIVENKPSPLPALKLQYVDFSEWQRQWLAGDELNKQLDYWKGQLSGVGPLELPLDQKRPAASQFRGASKIAVFPPKLQSALQDLGRREGCTLFVTLMAAYEIMLGLQSGQTDFAVGTALSGRTRREAEALLGFFVNTLPIRADLAGNPTCRELLARVRDTVNAAQSHQDVPFEKIVSAISSGGKLDSTPLIQAFFVLQNLPRTAVQLPGLRIAPEPFEFNVAKFDLTLIMQEQADGLLTILEYSTELFTPETADRFLERLRLVLEQLVADPDQRVRDLQLLSVRERTLLENWAHPVRPVPRKGVSELFEQQAVLRPEATALVQGAQRLSYADLNAAANRLAAHLRMLGVRADSRVAVSLERTPELIVTLLGILKAGGAYVPLDPTYPRERLEFMLRESRAKVLVTTTELLHQLPLECVSVVRLDRDAAEIATQSAENLNLIISPEQLTYVTFTSGSTGKPKGVGIPQRAVVRLVQNSNVLQYQTDDVILQFAPVAFDASTLEIWGPLLNGGQILQAPPGVVDVKELAELIRDGGVTTAWLTAGLFHHAVEHHLDELKHVRHLLAGGDTLALSYVCKALDTLSHTTLINGYGPTENTTFTSCHSMTAATPPIGSSVPIGTPVTNTSVYIVDEDLRPVPIGVPGELLTGGDGLARGYLEQPALTAERFIPNPFGNQAGMRLYRTGDLARWRTDGTLEFLGRCDQQVKIRGFRIELGEIEAQLQKLPKIAAAVVNVWEDGPNDKRLMAYCVPARDAKLDVPGIHTALQRTLPSYMVPASIVVLQALPLTSHGKVDRRALPAPDGSRSQVAIKFVAPRNELECKLADLWQDVLKVDRVGIHDNFFQLGGDSLKATQAVSRLREEFEIELPLRRMFIDPTIAGIAAALREEHDLALQQGPSLRPVNRNGELPLSFAQQRLWFLDQMLPGSPLYNVPLAARLTGPLDRVALQRSLDEIVRRHEVLRTTFPQKDGKAIQLIATEAKVPLRLISLSSQAEDSIESQIERLAREEALTPFALDKGPLVRVTLIQSAPEEHTLLLTLHHIVSDGWSMGVLFGEMRSLYSAFSAGKPSPLPELPLQYADFAHWQRIWLQSDVLEQQLAYWREQLSGLEPLALPTDHPRPAVQTFRGAKLAWTFSQAEAEGLRALCHQEGATLFMTLLAAFQVLLGRQAGQDDIAVGSPIAGRNRAEIEGLIGFFVNSLVLRGDLSGDPTFRQLVQRTREAALEAFAHQDVPFETLVDELHPQRNLSRSPLFQVMFAVQNAPLDGFGDERELADGLRVRPLDVGGQHAKFDLTLFVQDTADGIGGVLEYNADLFAVTTAQRLVTHLKSLVQEVLKTPDQPLSRIVLSSVAETEQVLRQFNQTEIFPFTPETVQARFRAQVEARPDEVALRHNGSTWSYRDIDRQSQRIARQLRARGVGPEVCVAVCADRSPELVCGMLGILKAGGAYVPLDPGYPAERLGFMLENCGANVLLTLQKHMAELPQHDLDVLFLDADVTTCESEADGSDPSVPVSLDNLAYVIYTSGSTGKPKGVAVTHAALANLIAWHQRVYDVTADDRATLVASVAFDASVWELWPYLTAGAGISIVGREVLGDPDRLLEWMASERTTLSFLPTPLAEQVVASRWQGEHSLRAILTGGDQLRQRPGVAAAFRLVNHYGPTENAVVATAGDVRVSDDSNRLPDIGGPIDRVQTYVLDRWMNPVAVGVPGELYLGGASLARGYLDDPVQTGERFVPNPFSDQPGSRLYRTGDACRWLAAGNLEFIGRIDQQVKIRGYRIELGEIEAALTQQPTVREAVVVAREDERGTRRLVAYLVQHADVTTETEQLRAGLKRQLPDYMVPSTFVTLAEIPVTRNGKVDRRALPEPVFARDRTAAPYVPPETDVEEQLVAIWQDLLAAPQIGIHDNFFELGGDSILSIQVVARANQAGLRLTPRQLFQHQTIAELADVVGTGDVINAEQGPVTGSVTLTPIQKWFFEQEFHAPQHFNQTVFLEVKQPLDVTALRQAATTLLAHHDALRLRFSEIDGTWTERNAAVAEESAERIFEVIDLTETPVGERTQKLEQLASDYQTRLNLESGPLMRIVLFQMGTGTDRLLIAVHHLAVDGVSWRILLEDLLAGYSQASQGLPVQLPPKTTSFQQWGQRLEDFARSDAIQEEIPFWRELARKPAVRLPLDYTGGVNEVASAETVVVSLNQEETRALLQEVPTAYRTQINDVLLLALTQTLNSWTGKTASLINLEGHGREELFDDVDLSRTVGWFTSMFPVRLELQGESDTGELLKSVKEQLRGIPNRGIGYGLLRYLRGDNGLTTALRRVRPQVSFNYLGQFDQALPETAFGKAPESSGSSHSLSGERTHVLEINGGISGGRLQLGWTFSPNLHTRERIESLGETFLTALRTIIEHCRQDDVGGYTPSDFPLAKLSQANLDQLIGSSREVEDIYPLSPTQAAILFYSLHAQQTGAYFERVSCTFAGDFRLAAFQRSWQRLLDRHPILRTRFLWRDIKDPLQIVQRPFAPIWDLHDWRDRSKDVQRRDLETLLAADRARGFDLTKAPLMRLAIIRLADDAWRFVWSYHHLILDGWSLPLLMKEVMTHYEMDVRGADMPLERPRAYRDYIAWLERQDPAAGEEFWRKELAGITGPSPLPAARNKPLADSDDDLHAHAERRLSEEATHALRQFARQHQLTLNTLVQGAWSILLSRYSGEEEVMFGIIVSGRSARVAGIDSMLGLFINALPLRVAVDARRPVREWLQALQEQQADIRNHEHCSLVQVHSWSDVPRGTPLFESVLSFDNYPIDRSLRQKGTSVEIQDVVMQDHSNFPLALVVGPGSELSLRINHDQRRLATENAQRVVEHLERLLLGLLDENCETIADLPMLNGSELDQLNRWNQTAVAFSGPKTVHEWIEAQAALTPDAEAVVSGDQRFTYKAVNARANQLARELQRRGITRESRIGVCVERSPLLVTALLAVWKAGGCYVPLDPAYPSERLAFLTRDAACDLLLTDRACAGLLPEIGMKTLVLNNDETLWDNERDDNLSLPVCPYQLAYVIYTSGSTGLPKGAMIPHSAAVNFLAWSQKAYPLGPADRVLHKTPISFDASVWELFAPLTTGATLILAAPGTQSVPHQLADLMQAERVTHLKLVPSLLRLFVETGALEKVASLRQIFSGGEALPKVLYEQARAKTSAAIHNLYGPTETTVDVTACDCQPDLIASLEGTEVVPIGKPVANTRLYLLDAAQNLVPIGVPGELHVGGENLARGYLSQPALTASSFVPDPFSSTPGARLYRTGDLCKYRPDGTIEFLRRIDHQVKLRGFRIELGEIEKALLKVSAVKAAVVCVKGDISENQQLVAYVVAGDEAESFADLMECLKQELRDHLPEYMIPAVFVPLEAMPLTPSGKIDRNALPEPGQERRVAEEYVAPRDELESRLVEIWEELLEVSPVGVTDSFFELGGHSILVLKLMTRIEEEFQRTMSLAMLTQGATIETLATVIRDNDSAPKQWSSLVELQPAGTKRPFFCIHPGGGNVLSYFELAHQLGTERPVYGLQAVGLDGTSQPHATIPEMAAHYLSAIRSVQPQGPYLLGGHSAGGPIALEMAHQLMRSGEDVAQLVIFDAAPPDYYGSSTAVPAPEADDATLLAGTARTMESFLGTSLNIQLEEMQSLQGDDLLRYVLGKLKEVNFTPPGDGIAVLRGMLNVTKSLHRAMAEYRPEKEPRPRVTLFRANDRAADDQQNVSAERAADPTWGWNEWACGEVVVSPVAGDHVTMLAPPHAASLAEKLRVCLEEAEGKCDN